MTQRTVYLETFGCQMNELDSELVEGRLRTLGYRFVPRPEQAGVVLYNTCSVREHAEQKVWSRLGELALRKAEEPGLVVGVLGCMAERDGESLLRRMPVVDVLCGPGELDKLPALLDNAFTTRQSLLAEERTLAQAPVHRVSARQVALQGNTSRRSATLAAAEDTLELLDLSRATSPADADPDRPRRSAYVRITRGCNKFCTYCVVPFTRGAEVHRPPHHIVEECRRLADEGVIEITLLGQTVNHYRFEHGAAVTIGGVLQPQKGRVYAAGEGRRDGYAGEQVTTFADLLRMIHDEVPAIRRLRFVTSYPRDFGDDVLEVIRDHPRICRYLHVPAQSGSDRMLKLMNRGYTVSEYLEFLDRARAFLHQPERGRPLMLSGDFIVGFPTETEEDHAASLELVRRARYKNAFIFKYSPRPGTVAIDRFADDVIDAVKRRRNTEMLDAQAAVSAEIHREQVGSHAEVFIEGLSTLERKKSARAAKSGTIALTVAGRSMNDDPAPSENAAACSTDGSSVFAPASPGAGVQLSARTDGDLIVHLNLPDMDHEKARELVGRMMKVRITESKPLALVGMPEDLG